MHCNKVFETRSRSRGRRSCPECTKINMKTKQKKALITFEKNHEEGFHLAY